MPAKKTAKKTTKKAPAKKSAAKKTATSAKASAAKAKKASAKKSAGKGDSTKKSIKTPTLLRGMKDILPKDEWYWKQMYHTAEEIADAYGYSRIETPVLEDAGLFVRSLGKGTDVVDKEMYVFEDRDGSKVGLRPEMTASVARSYLSHGMHTYPQPVKVWYWASMFRHDRPQAGRFREFRQFGFENIGRHDPVVDAEVISGAYNFIKDLGVNTVVHINSIGTLEDRERYIIELVGYLRSKRSYLSDLSKKRLNKNPLRILDSKEEQDQPIIEEAPQIIDWLSESSKKFFMGVLEYLDELEIPYVLDPTLVRGLDYYTDTVFELFEEGAGEGGSQSALGAGGRYNGLIEQIGGPETPGCGFSIGLERVLAAVRKQHQTPEGEEEVVHNDVPIFFAQLGEQARKRALVLIEKLRRSGLRVRHSLGKASLKAQLELANKYGATHTLILGQKEVQDGTIIVRDMDSGIQEIIDQGSIEKQVKKIS